MNPKDILIKPIITEKSLEIVKSQNGYTFQVDRRAAKPQIARAVEQFFNVKVQNIRTITTPGRLRRQLKKRQTYRTPDVKKAIVQLEKGQTIDLFETKSSK